METPVGRALLRLTGVLLVLVALVALVAPRPGFVEYNRWVVAPTAIVAVCVAVLGTVPDALKNRWVPVAVSVGGGALAAGLGLLLRYPYGWDARVIIEMARALHAGRGLSQGDYDYLSLYPNTIPLLAIERVGVAVGAGLGVSPDAVLITLTGVCVTATLYAAHLLVVPVAGRGGALLTQLVVLGLVGVSPWVSVPYTDFYAMPFVVGGAALACAAWRRRGWVHRMVLGSLAVGAISVAYVIKTTPAVLIVALVMVSLARLADYWSASRARRALGLAVGATVLFGLVSVALTAGSASVAGIDRSRVDPAVTPPLVWWFANGMNEQVSATGQVQYGTYTRDMVDAIEGRTSQEMTHYARTYIQDRWDERGFVGTMAFYANKAAWNWGDGMFWAWGEGLDSRPGVVAPEGAVSEAVAAVNGLHGRWYSLRADLAQGLWLAVLLVAGAGLLRAPVRRETVLLALTVLGIAAFTVAFQGRSRYLFAFVPIVVALAAMGRPRLSADLHRRLRGRALHRRHAG